MYLLDRAVYPLVGEFWLLDSTIPAWSFPAKIVRVESEADDYGILLISVVGMKAVGFRRIHKKWFYLKLAFEEGRG